MKPRHPYHPGCCLSAAGASSPNSESRVGGLPPGSAFGWSAGGSSAKRESREPGLLAGLDFGLSAGGSSANRESRVAGLPAWARSWGELKIEGCPLSSPCCGACAQAIPDAAQPITHENSNVLRSAHSRRPVRSLAVPPKSDEID